MSTAIQIPILMYHKVAPVDRRSKVAGHYVSPSQFRRQVKALRLLGYQTVKLGSLFEEELPKKPVVLSFDDGYENFLTNAIPIMRESNMNGTVFMVANQIGGTNQWDVQIGDVEERLMTLDQLKEAVALGAEVGSHTLDHAHLDQVEMAEARRQIVDSRTRLTEALGVPIDTFCYPYGGKTSQVLGLVEEAGYRVACSTDKGINSRDTNRYALKRINIRSDTILPVFLMKLWRAYRLGR